MKEDNKIIVDLEKCVWVNLVWRNQYGNTSPARPHYKSVRGEIISGINLAYFHPEYPGETELERVERLGLLDVWTPELTLKLQASEYLVYVGDKALKLYDAWNASYSARRIHDKNWRHI